MAKISTILQNVTKVHPNSNKPVKTAQLVLPVTGEAQSIFFNVQCHLLHGIPCHIAHRILNYCTDIFHWCFSRQLFSLLSHFFIFHIINQSLLPFLCYPHAQLCYQAANIKVHTLKKAGHLCQKLHTYYTVK